MLIDYGRGPEEAVVSVETLMVYEHEFGGDMIRDFLGVQDFSEGEGDGGESVDFRQVNWTALVRMLWAALKTANPDLPGFREWGAGLGDVNLLQANSALGAEVVRKFFRAETALTQ